MLAERVAQWPKVWMAEGFLEGKRATLIEQLEERFGSLDTQHRERVEKATEKQLKGWLKAVLTASTADDVLRS